MFNTDTTELPESLVSYVENNAVAIDCGIIISRIVLVVNNDRERKSIRYFCTENNKLKETLENIHEIVNDDLLNKGFVTGFRKLWAKSIVESVFDLNVLVVDEDLAMSDGFGLVSNHLSMDDIEYKTGDLSYLTDRYKFDENNPMIKQFKKSMEVKSDDVAEIDENKINVPAIFIIAGSFTRYFLAKKDQSLQLLSTSIYGRSVLGGLSKCLIDLNNTAEILEMANNGNRENVDTQVWEMFSDNEKSPYGKLPDNVPIFPFGKSADYDIKKEDFNRVDLMESLCNLIFNNVVHFAIQFCKIFKTKSIYLCGDMLNAPVFGKFLYLHSTRISNIRIRMLTCDYMMALGTLKK